MNHANSTGRYLRLGGVSSTYASKIRKVLRAKLGDPHLSRLAGARREKLHDAIFEVEDDLESKAGGQSNHPQVLAMNKARNLVLDDLGWNDPK